MSNNNIWTRRGVLAAAGTGALATVGAGSAAAQEQQGEDGPENSIRISFPDCETIRVQGARVLNDQGYYLRFGVVGLTTNDRTVGYSTDIMNISFPFEVNLAEILYDYYDSSEFVGAVAVRGIVRDPDGNKVTARLNPDRDECWLEFGDETPW